MKFQVKYKMSMTIIDDYSKKNKKDSVKPIKNGETITATGSIETIKKKVNEQIESLKEQLINIYYGEEL